MLPFLRKHRELLGTLFLLVLPLVVYASHAADPVVPGPVRQAVLFVTSPVQRSIVWTVETAQDTWYAYVDLRGTHNRNRELLAEVHRLRADRDRMGELEAENGRLKRLVDYAASLPDLVAVAAPVIALGPDPKFRTMRLGRGSRDGLRPGMPVVTPDGVVGRLSQVYETSADVQLVIDPASAVAAMSQRTRARASAHGIGRPDRLRLDYVVRSEDMQDGDILVTAPSGGLFPKGLRLGRAIRVEDNAHGLFKSAELVPAVDFERLEEVLVVMDRAPAAARDVPLTALPH